MHGATNTAMTGGRRFVPATALSLAVGAMIAGAAYALAMGEDANWDLRNYHTYNVWATVTDRYAIDAAPAGFQTYFNPLPYFPVYYLKVHLSPLWSALIMGAVHGLNLVAIYGITRILL